MNRTFFFSLVLVGAIVMNAMLLSACQPISQLSEAMPASAAEGVPSQGATQADTEEALAPDEVIKAFYAEYIAYIGDPATDQFRNPLVDRAYRDSAYLSKSFIAHLDEMLDNAGDYGIGYDPILCAQDIPTDIEPQATWMHAETASVVIGTSFPNHVILADLRQHEGAWQIANLSCGMEPTGSVRAFYTWYLAQFGDRSQGEFHNPLVDGTYRESGLVSEAFLDQVAAELAAMEMGAHDMGSGDPFLMAQDLPQEFSVDPGQQPDEVIVHLQFSPESVRHLAVSLENNGGVWLITGIREAR